MTTLRFALFPLLAVFALDCFPLSLAADDAVGEPDRATIEERWPDGTLRERKQVVRLDDGTTVNDGTFERWYADGTLEYRAVFALGKKEGETVRYHANGRVASRQHYHDGKLDGPSISWDDQGRKVKEENWADGRPHGTWTIWKDGNVEWTHTFDHGDPDPGDTTRGDDGDAPQRSMVDGDPVPDARGDGRAGQQRRGDD
jgi:hypothetical protein